MKNTKNKILSLLLTAAMVCAVLPTPALAADSTTHIDYGSITISQNASSSTKLDVTYYASSGAGSTTTTTIPASDNIVITQTDAATSTGNTITVSGSIANKVNITLSGVNINVSGSSDTCAFSIGTGSAVKLALKGDNILKSGAGCAGLQVPSGAGLAVTANSTGSLAATGGGYGAGIGGGAGSNGGTMTINGGTVTATGGSYGAGIGGGGASFSHIESGDGGTLAINGGTVTATGGYYGVGIGGGTNSIGYDGGDGGTVTISGGTVTATGTDDCPDIGGGMDFDDGGGNGILYISGGSVNADVSFDVYQSSAKTIKVYETTVKGLRANSTVTCSINGGDMFSCKTDSSGYLYLWLPSGDGEARVKCDASCYQASGTIAESNSNELTVTESLIVDTNSLPNGAVGTVYSKVLSASGGTETYDWTIDSGTLPDGLSLASDGIISGTPTEAGRYTVTVKASDAKNLTGTKTLSITVYQTLSVDLSALSVSGGTLSPTFDRDITAYAVTKTSGAFGDSIAITATTADSSSALTINGGTATSGVASTVSLSVGTNRIPVAVTSADGLSQKTYVLTVTRKAVLSISDDGVTVAVAGQAYSKTLSASGGSGPYTWSVSGLPSGLTLNADTGVISGSASTVGSYPLTIIVTDSDGKTAQKTLTLKVMKGNGNGAYLTTPDSNADYTSTLTDDGLPTMTVNSGVKGFTYFSVTVEAVTGHSDMETVVFVQLRDGQQIAFSFLNADFDTVVKAGAGFNVKPGDIIEVYLVDSLSESGNSPCIL